MVDDNLSAAVTYARKVRDLVRAARDAAPAGTEEKADLRFASVEADRLFDTLEQCVNSA